MRRCHQVKCFLQRHWHLWRGTRYSDASVTVTGKGRALWYANEALISLYLAQQLLLDRTAACESLSHLVSETSHFFSATKWFIHIIFGGALMLLVVWPVILLLAHSLCLPKAQNSIKGTRFLFSKTKRSQKSKHTYTHSSQRAKRRAMFIFARLKTFEHCFLRIQLVWFLKGIFVLT